MSHQRPARLATRNQLAVRWLRHPSARVQSRRRSVDGVDREQIAAILEVATSAATPPTWTLPAVALGKQSTARAELFWAEHVLADGDLDFQIDGMIKP